MKKLLLLIICCAISSIAIAQSTVSKRTVKGMVIDSTTSQPLGFVTIALQDTGSKATIQAMLSKEDGTFELTFPSNKSCQLSMAFVGYKNRVVLISGRDTSPNLGRIALKASVSSLKEVTITGVKPLVKQEIDRIAYNVQADPESKTLTALDMMRKVPLLTVDATDAIRLKGNSNYKILINGKESSMVTSNPSDVLRAMPASSIDRIEVITIPPAKYDAEGLAGIINIVTKKPVGEGYNVSISTRYDNLYGPGATLNTSAKKGNFGITAVLNYTHQNSKDYLFSNNQTFTDGESLAESGANLFGRIYRSAGTEVSYEIDSLNLIAGSFNYFDVSNNTDLTQITNTYNQDAQLIQQYNQTQNASNVRHTTEASINYQLGFKKDKNRLLTLSYKYSYTPMVDAGDFNFFNRLNYPQSVQPDFFQNDNSGIKEHTIQLDYAHPLKEVTIEAGAKGILRNNYSSYNRSDLDSATNQYHPNTAETDNFNYHQDVYSFYNSYQAKFDNWSAKAGLRLEHTAIDGSFTSDNNSKVDQNYNNFIPSISIQRQLGTSTINVGYTQRIQRPGIGQINPFVDESNPKFVSTGNPNLRPELDNTFELNYTHFGKNSLVIGSSYAFSNNSIQQVTSLQVVNNPNSTKDTITSTTYQNLGTNQTLNVNFSVGLNLTPKLSANFNGRIARVWLSGIFDDQLYKNSGYTGNGYGSVGYKFDNGYRAGVNAGYVSSNVTLQGTTSSYVYTSLSASKDLLAKKATIGFVVSNPFQRSLAFHAITNTSEFHQQFINNNPYRTFALRVSYKFGKLETEIKKNQHGINNDDTKGS